jgi:succinoglycan biosynthesis transport protein ExoP
MTEFNLDDPRPSRGPAGPHLDPAASPPGGLGRPGASPAYVDDDDHGGIHLRNYIRVLYKRRWMVMSVFLTVMVAVAVYTFTTTPIYEARTRILIENDPNVVSFEGVLDEEQAQPDYYTTQYNILRSRALARRTIDALDAWEHPRLAPRRGFFATVAETFSSWTGRVADVASGAQAPDTDNDLASLPETPAQSAVIDAFLRGVSVSPVRNSRLVDVTFASTSAAFSTRVVNTLAETYLRENLEHRLGASRDANDWLMARLAEQRKELEAAEARLQEYREQNNALSLQDSQDIVTQKLTALNTEVTAARTERLRQESLYKQLQEARNQPGALDSFPAILNNQLIQQQKIELAGLTQKKAQLAETFGDRHPEMVAINSAIDMAQAKLDAEIEKVVAAVTAEYQAALTQENTLVAALAAQEREVQNLNGMAVEYGVLERNAQSARQLYDNLLQRAQETGVAGELRTSGIRIVDPAAEPREPARPRKALNLALGLIVALIGSVGLAFLFEYFDNRVKTPEEMEAVLGITSLAMLPAVSSPGGGDPIMTGSVPAGFSEALRVLRTNLLFARADPHMRSVMITSTGVGEGKSVVAGNLAIAIAQTGQRVLFIDADLRRPRAHTLFQESQEPGLSNLLVGTATSEEAIRTTNVEGLVLLPAGHIPPNPAELLGSTRFRSLLESAGQQFDWVIIDSPPIMPVTDAAVVGHMVSGVLFVVHSEKTSRHAAAQAVGQLQRANARIIGGVLNRVDLQRNPYYYSAYYSRDYTRYYVPAERATSRSS